MRQMCACVHTDRLHADFCILTVCCAWRRRFVARLVADIRCLQLRRKNVVVAETELGARLCSKIGTASHESQAAPAC